MQNLCSFRVKSKSGKLIAQLLNEASNLGSSYRFILFDKTSNRQYLVDTGADLSVIPSTPAEKRKPTSNFTLVIQPLSKLMA
ncbi:hypothetical protein TNIN_291441 [Trichonephila inaurata madagascariensis]|uniref:Peptidase A2 domain-containing protein n=1 Tax=Trichonephila inaurata madagascariensis TaxID=2747483 RepID=A0A8X6WNJ1_9ARAC|nr:hypothetical protein TNIN_291441 [Trichonephila inaurata madagascariensis]